MRVLERRTVIVAALAIYLAASSLFYLGNPRIARVRVSRTGIGLTMGAYVLPPMAEGA